MGDFPLCYLGSRKSFHPRVLSPSSLGRARAAGGRAGACALLRRLRGCWRPAGRALCRTSRGSAKPLKSGSLLPFRARCCCIKCIKWCVTGVFTPFEPKHSRVTAGATEADTWRGLSLRKETSRSCPEPTLPAPHPR
ncbi:hypothetical protein HJG60_009194 [Phyllostomus discolor]|uniref:Uncharacterized protein n=1 Tax=Phyllostomus discolor TaxID=89673 RepID=A0A833YS50_9CHIR|nr:hypothetical protein HJG60_009194 [Phyllostomus discolor]